MWMNRLIIGIDPGGSSGYLAGLFVDGTPLEGVPMPQTPADILEALKSFGRHPVALVMMEQVGVMPHDGGRSARSFGRNVGHLEMALTAAGYKWRQVRPQVWQQELGCLTKGDKAVTQRTAQALFPGLKVTKRNADAWLIAEYGRRIVLEERRAVGDE